MRDRNNDHRGGSGGGGAMLCAALLWRKANAKGGSRRAGRWSGAKAPPENRDRHGQDGPKYHPISWRALALDGGRR